jgi:hypothetical protein
VRGERKRGIQRGVHLSLEREREPVSMYVFQLSTAEKIKKKKIIDL